MEGHAMRRVIPAAALVAVLLLAALPVLADTTGGGGWGPGNGQIQATFKPAGKVSALGVAQVKVTWSCGTAAVPWTGPVSISFNMVLTQPVNRTQSVQAQVFGTQSCDPGVSNTTSAAIFVPAQGMFVSGAATLQVSVNGNDQNGLSDQENFVVTLTF
jgi:hypothetical protein